MDYREKIVHGDEGLPFAVYSVTPSHVRYHMELHWHPEHEILFVQDGTFSLRLNDTVYLLHPGDVVLICGGTIHSGEPEACVYTCFLVNPGLMMKKEDACMDFFRRTENGSLQILPRLSDHSPVFAALCRQMCKVYRAGGEAYPFRIKGLIFEFWGHIAEQKLYTEARPSHDSAVNAGILKTVIRYMEERYNTRIRLSELAALVDLTPNHFCRSFREITGYTPLAYLNRHRLARARYALATSDLSVTEIALDCGFNDVSHFIRCFRLLYGTTPKQFRQEISARQNRKEE